MGIHKVARATSRHALSSKVVSAQLDSETLMKLNEWADQHTAGNKSDAIRMLLSEALGSSSALSGLEGSLEDRGYNAGMRTGLAEARSAIAEALNGLWKQG